MNGEGKKICFTPLRPLAGLFCLQYPSLLGVNTRCQVQEHTGHKAVVPEGQGYCPAISS